MPRYFRSGIKDRLESHLYNTLPVIDERQVAASDFELVVTAAQTTLAPARTGDPAADAGVLAEEHVATLGAQLFSRHLVAIEIAGTLLLAALVGAIAIVGHDRPQPRHAARPAARPAGRS